MVTYCFLLTSLYLAEENVRFKQLIAKNYLSDIPHRDAQDGRNNKR